MSTRNKLLLTFIIVIAAFLVLGTTLIYRDYRQALTFGNRTQHEIAIKDYSSGQTMILGDDGIADVLLLIETDIRFGGLRLNHEEIPLYDDAYCITVFSQNDIQQIFLGEKGDYNYLYGDIFWIKTKSGADILSYMNQLFGQN